MENITLGDLLLAVDGKLLGDFQNLSTVFSHVETDSRKVKPLDLFFALIGERFDAHDFVEDIKEGVGFVISKELSHYQGDKFYVLVEDTQKALGDLAKWYRNSFDIPFIAVTGSVGKTTTKDMIGSILGEKFSVHKTQGNFNNLIGLPLTLLNLERKHQISVVELGMDCFGEIEYMANIVKPDFAVITNLGEAHIERLGSRENIKKAKYELIPHIKNHGVLIRNGSETFEKYAEIPSIIVDKLGDTTSFQEWDLEERLGNPELYQAVSVNTVENTLTKAEILCDKGDFSVEIPALGEHMVYPVMIGLGIGFSLDLTLEEMKRGISNFSPSKMRMNQLVFNDSIIFLDDTYNANPQSMEAGVEILSNQTSDCRIAVLGDMMELGDFSKESHQKIGAFVAEKEIDFLFAVGTLSVDMAESAKNIGKTKVFHCETKEIAFDLLKDKILPNTVILFKGSRSMALDKLVKNCEEYVKGKYLT